MTIAKPEKTAKPRTAASLECSKEADEKGLKGKERKKFRSECKANAAKSAALFCFVAGVLAGWALGSLVGLVAPGIIAGVFFGFFGGLLLVRARFRDL